MTIECYHADCPHHSTHTDPDDGPFCYRDSCVYFPETDEYDDFFGFEGASTEEAVNAEED